MTSEEGAFGKAEISLTLAAVRTRSGGDLTRADHEDIASEIILQALRAQKSHGGEIGRYVAQGVARTSHYVRQRRRYRRSERAAGLLVDISGSESHAQMPRQVYAGPDQASDRLDRDCIDSELDCVEIADLLRCLPRDHAVAFVLVDWHGHTLREAAELMGVSHMTVARFRRAAISELRSLVVPELAA
ncbi:MAG TPA: sigma-70 region 4 domain-containing protein [Acidimicrobiia bacterium]